MKTDKEIASAALDTLHGARGRNATHAASELRSYVNSIKSSKHVHAADAARTLGKLVDELDMKGSASDDVWQEAIEAMATFTNETM